MGNRSLASAALHISTQAAFRLGSRLTVRGRENVPATGPVIIIANHTHNADPALINAIMARPVMFLAKRELVTGGNAISRWLVRNYGVIPVSRGRPDRDALKMASQVLNNGGIIGMFPEGTRSRDGALSEASRGTAYLAVSSGAPVLPIGIEGLHKLTNNPLQAGRRPRITARIGEPFDLPGATDQESLQRATGEMMRAVVALLPEKMHGYYSESERSHNPARVNASES